jgi:hypothetical protein
MQCWAGAGRLSSRESDSIELPRSSMNASIAFSVACSYASHCPCNFGTPRWFFRYLKTAPGCQRLEFDAVKLGTPSWPLFRATPHGTASSQSQAADTTRGTFAEARGASQAETFSQLCGLVPRPASEQAATRRRKRVDSPCFAASFGVASSHSIHQVAPV